MTTPPMTRVVFAKAFRRHIDCPDEAFEGVATLGAALDAYFARNPAVRGYVLDEAGRIRRHITVFVDDDQVPHTDALATAVTPSTTIHVFQALSGG